MNNINIINEILKALSIDFPSQDQKSNLSLKMRAVENYMSNAGVSDRMKESDLGQECIIIGVTDIWNLNAGEIKFSPAFNIILEQLKVMSLE